MTAVNNLGKIFILGGLIFIIIGVALSVNIKIPWLGKLPGDICIQRKNFSFYFPITTCLLISAIITLILKLCRR